MGFESLRIRSVARVDLSLWDPADTSSFRGGKHRAESALRRLIGTLDRLQELLYADGRFGVLVVLQGVDTSGKDGTIRHVFEGVNPQGVRVSSFKAPTPSEAAHDFLWRIHRETPGRGEIVIFNRSQYEDVLVPRVHHQIPPELCALRYRAINQFEQELTEEGVTVVKFFLHISKDEQRRRLDDRRRDPTKRWKLSVSDLRERRYWSEYTKSYEEMLAKTATAWAPWYIVPSDKKWFRNLVVSTVLVEALERLNLRYPRPAVLSARGRIR